MDMLWCVCNFVIIIECNACAIDARKQRQLILTYFTNRQEGPTPTVQLADIPQRRRRGQHV